MGRSWPSCVGNENVFHLVAPFSGALSVVVIVDEQLLGLGGQGVELRGSPAVEASDFVV